MQHIQLSPTTLTHHQFRLCARAAAGRRRGCRRIRQRNVRERARSITVRGLLDRLDHPTVRCGCVRRRHGRRIDDRHATAMAIRCRVRVDGHRCGGCRCHCRCLSGNGRRRQWRCLAEIALTLACGRGERVWLDGGAAAAAVGRIGFDENVMGGWRWRWWCCRRDDSRTVTDGRWCCCGRTDRRDHFHSQTRACATCVCLKGI